jgi:integrase
MNDAPDEPRPPRLRDRLHEAIKLRRYSPRTEEAYRTWIKRFILFHGRRHPRELGPPEIEAFLTHLATDEHVSASTQNQALAALLFLYVHVLGQAPGAFAEFVRAKRPARVPVVLTPAEVSAVLGKMDGVPALMAALLYGSGLGLLECAHLRVKDADLELREQLARARAQHAADVGAGAGWVELPDALDRKLPNAGREWPWQWVFPATRTYVDPERGRVRRHHLHESVLQKSVRAAVLAAGLPRRAGCHTRSHSFATQLLEAGYTISEPSRRCSGTRTSARR